MAMRVVRRRGTKDLVKDAIFLYRVQPLHQAAERKERHGTDEDWKRTLDEASILKNILSGGLYCLVSKSSRALSSYYVLIRIMEIL